MKHPYQHLVLRSDGLLFASAENSVYVLKGTELVFKWTDEVDPLYSVRKHHKELLEKYEKDQSGKKPPKLPLPGPGTPVTFSYIRGLKLSRNGQYLITLTDFDKAAVIFKIGDQGKLELVKRQPFAKRPCALTTSLDDEQLIVADKFGDVFQVPLLGDVIDEKDLLPLLGHVSMLTCVDNTLDEDGKQVVITSDRDEHIRVSYYPQSFVIKKWLFGHREFVSNFVLPSWGNGKVVVSGGGDSYICSWLWQQDKDLITKYDISEIVQPYLSEKHLAPSKFQNESNTLKEYCVSSIIPLDVAQRVLVIFEKMNVLALFKLSSDGVLTFDTTVETAEDVICATYNDERLIVSMPSHAQEYSVGADGIQPSVKLPLLGADIDKKTVPLFTVNGLRKRREF